MSLPSTILLLASLGLPALAAAATDPYEALTVELKPPSPPAPLPEPTPASSYDSSSYGSSTEDSSSSGSSYDSDDADDDSYDYEDRRPATVALRAGLGATLGVLGVALELRPSNSLGIILGTGTHKFAAGLSFPLLYTSFGFPYLDLHYVVIKPGLPKGDVGPKGHGLGATMGFDLRPSPSLSLKAGVGFAYVSTRSGDNLLEAIKERPLVVDLNAGVAF